MTAICISVGLQYVGEKRDIVKLVRTERDCLPSGGRYSSESWPSGLAWKTNNMLTPLKEVGTK